MDAYVKPGSLNFWWMLEGKDSPLWDEFEIYVADHHYHIALLTTGYFNNAKQEGFVQKFFERYTTSFGKSLDDLLKSEEMQFSAGQPAAPMYKEGMRSDGEIVKYMASARFYIYAPGPKLTEPMVRTAISTLCKQLCDREPNLIFLGQPNEETATFLKALDRLRTTKELEYSKEVMQQLFGEQLAKYGNDILGGYTKNDEVWVKLEDGTEERIRYTN